MEGSINFITQVQNNNVDEVKRLILTGIDINYTDQYRRTALWFAVHFGYIECATVLLDAKADVNKCDSRLESPILTAAFRGNDEIVGLLIRHNADVCLTDGYLTSPLHYASHFGYLKCVEMLVNANASIEAIDAFGLTPLARSIKCNQHYCVQHLLYSGAKLRKVNRSIKYTPVIQRIIMKRKRAIHSTRILKGVLRMRFKVDGAEGAYLNGRIPKDVVNLVGSHVWSTRLDDEWGADTK